MPSWLVASIKVACSIAHKVERAARLPSSARGSIWDRRAEITANSAPTKNALTSSKTMSQMSPGTYSATVVLICTGLSARTRRRQRLGFSGGVAEAADPCPIHSLHSEAALRDGHLVPDFGESIELVDDEPTNGLVVGGVRNSHPGPLQQFIRSPVGIEDQTPAVADQTRVGLVVLVAQLADDLLHQVLEGHNAGRAAVLVEDDADLEDAAAQRSEQRVNPHGLRHPDRVDHQIRDGHLRPGGGVESEGLLDMDDAEDVIGILADHREAGEPGALGQVDDIGGGMVREPQGSVEQGGVVGVQHAFGGRASNQEAELLGGPGPRQLLLRLDPESANDRISGVV